MTPNVVPRVQRWWICRTCDVQWSGNVEACWGCGDPGEVTRSPVFTSQASLARTPDERTARTGRGGLLNL